MNINQSFVKNYANEWKRMQTPKGFTMTVEHRPDTEKMRKALEIVLSCGQSDPPLNLLFGADNGDDVLRPQFQINKTQPTEFRQDFVPIPAELKAEAAKALGGLKETTIDLKAKTPLANFAAQRRKKNKRKAQKESRRRNR